MNEKLTGPFHWVYEGSTKEEIELSMYKNIHLQLLRDIDGKIGCSQNISSLWVKIWRANRKVDVLLAYSNLF